MARRRPFCSEVSFENAEPLAATASRVDHWLLVEHRGPWTYDALAGSGLTRRVQSRLRELAAARPRTKLLLVRRPRRGRGGGDGISVIWGSSPEHGGALVHTLLERYDDVLGLDPAASGTPLDHPVVLVCTHGKHDRCCARRGRPLYQALAEHAEQGWVWQASHLGGDRFAGNAVFLPEGLYFGRVGPDEAPALLAAYLAGRIDLDHYRGRCCYPFAVQAAERAVREASGATGVDDLELVRRDGGSVAFRAAGRVYELEVAEELAPPAQLTCAAEGLRSPRRFAARILRESAA
jgi:hypothetical protein